MKNKLTITTLLSISLILGSIYSNAQEIINRSVGYPVLKQISKKTKNLKASLSDTLELPFFDDFSNSYYYPSTDRWADNYAFINNTYPINPPSIGVATLDAIDNNGEFYTAAGYGNYFSSDTLSSLPLNLNFPGDQTIYLSFYYESRGYGDAPQPADTLFLEFYSPVDSVWERAWFTDGDIQTDTFFQAMVQVVDAKYLKKGFRFRFRNIASLSGDKDPTKAINVDHWHIDYVYLNRGRNASDIITHDIAFVYPLESHLKRYEAMPWKHFMINSANELGINVLATYKNNDNISRLVDSIYVVYSDRSGNQLNDTLFGGAYDMSAGQQRVFNPPFTYPFLTNTTDSASFKIKARLVTDEFDSTINNEVSYIQKFYDYYAYDDGTAEASYGLKGEGTQNASLAVQFNCAKEDTLNAIQMYFNRSLNDESQDYFYLTIWDDNGGEPGNIIYQRSAVRPEYESELNKFHTYFIDDTTLVLDGVFYVGWIQTQPTMLNLGLDFNRTKNEYTFFNISGLWTNSVYEAALMIRPFFGKNLSLANKPVETEVIIPNVKIYPNPAKDKITINISNITDYKQLTLQIFSITGAVVYQNEYINLTPIDLTGLKEGIYLIRLTDKGKKLNYSGKFIKTN